MFPYLMFHFHDHSLIISELKSSTEAFSQFRIKKRCPQTDIYALWVHLNSQTMSHLLYY